eukprot:4027394-Pyramimonas_sp.AAC.1
MEWLRRKIGGTFIDQALSITPADRAWATDPSPEAIEATEVACRAAAAAAIGSGRLIGYSLLPGTPRGEALRLAIALRTRARGIGATATVARDERQQGNARVGGGARATSSPVPSPTALPPHRNEGNVRRVLQEVQDIRSQVANDNVPPNMTWSRLVAPFIWGTATEEGRATLEQAFEASGVPSSLARRAGETWQQ